MSMQRTTIVAPVLVAVALTAGSATLQACSRHETDHAQDDASHGAAAQPAVEPTSYAEAVGVIHDQLAKIGKLIDTKDLARVHAEAAVVRDTALALGKLALEPGSGIPREAVKEVNLAAKDLAASFEPIDAAGDSGDLAGTRKIYQAMVARLETLEKYLAPGAAHPAHDGH